MLINGLLKITQNILRPIYDKSFFLQNIDWLIFINVILVILSSTFAQSDTIGYFAIFAIILTFIKLLTKTEEKLEFSASDKLLLLYFMIVVISVMGSSLFLLSLKGFFKTLTYLGFYLSLINYLKDNTDKIKYLFFAFIMCLCYETIFAFVQNFGSVDEISGWQDMSRLNPEEVMTRVYGTLKPYNPNLFGGYLLAIIPTILSLPLLLNKNINERFKIFITSAIGLLTLIALILTGCRGAYIGLFFELVLLVSITYKLLENKFKKAFMAFIGSCIIGLSVIVSSTTALRARLFSIFAMRNDSSNSFRLNVYNSCIDMFKDNWLLGIGCGNQNFREIYGLYMKTGFDALSAYNIYLETAVESGIFALLTFLAFILLILYCAIKYILKGPEKDKIFVLIAFISIVGILMHGFVDTVFFRPQIQFTFWTMVSIIRVLTDKRIYD